MNCPVPDEPLWSVFTPDAVGRLQSVAQPSEALDFRLRVLGAGGLNPSAANRAQRAYKAAWEVYLTAAFVCGLLDGAHGADLMARLTGVNDDNFRSAMSECLVAWYLAGRLKLRVAPRPEGRPGHPLELAVKLPDGDINVEVKAPYRPIPGDFWWGDDSDALQSALREANKQFKAGARNLLVVVPTLRLPICDQWRLPVERAFIGETVISVPIDTGTGGPAGPTTFPFKLTGDLTKAWPKPGQPQRAPRFTRISALLCLNDYDDGPEVKHRALIVHNPNAAAPLPREPWSGIPEFSQQSGEWRWSDADDLERLDREPSLWDVLRDGSDWLTDPAGTFEAALRAALRR